MNIVINAVFSNLEPRGPGKYANNLISSFAELDKDNEYYVYYGKWMEKYPFIRLNQNNFHMIELDIKNNIVTRNFYLAFVMPLVCKKVKPDVFMLLDTQAILIKPCFMTSTIHDLAEFEVSEKYPPYQALMRKIILRIQVKISDHIFTVSEYSRRDICKRFTIPGDRVTVTYNLNDLSIGKSRQEEPEHFFLFVGEVEKAKNLKTLIKAFAMLDVWNRREYRIVVVGKKGNAYEEVCKMITEYNISDRVNFLGYVSDNQLAELYSKCYAFVFPSVFEGFGIPVLEAMALGTPVICSDSSSIPEVGGDAVLYFSPNDATKLKEHMQFLINCPEERENLIRKGKAQAEKFNGCNGVKKTWFYIQNFRKAAKENENK